MTGFDIAQQRLHSQCLIGATFENPAEVVGWFGAVQAQDFLAALWAVGLRLPDATEADVEQAIADKSLVRTWFMRGTIHFVTADDIRWMLKLMEPRMRMLSDNTISYHRLELDDATMHKSLKALEKALRGGKQLTRPELAAALEQAGIAPIGLRLMSILHRAESLALICHGPRRGKQFTFTLLDEWVPPSKLMDRDESLAELTRRYFMSHGPATLQDFVWWSGLTTAEAKAGMEMAKPHLVQEKVDGQTYWLSPSVPRACAKSTAAYLLPNFDEYLVSYRDRSASVEGQQSETWPRGNVLFSSTLTIGGRVVGTWKRIIDKNRVIVMMNHSRTLTAAETRALAATAQRYGKFLGLPVVLQ